MPIALLLPLTLAIGQAAPPPPAAATAALAPFDGAWRGTATLTQRDGAVRTLVHTERVGPALGGAIRVVEGHSYNPDGSDAGFNAFAIAAPAEGGGFEFRTWAQGRGGTFPMTVTAGGFSWAMPAGPGAVVRYTATANGGTWHEEGWLERGGARVSKVFDMTVKRLDDTDWPAGAPVPPR